MGTVRRPRTAEKPPALVAHVDATPVRVVGRDDQSDYAVILEVDVAAPNGFEKLQLRLDDEGWRSLLHQLGDVGNTIAGQRLCDLAAKRSGRSLS